MLDRQRLARNGPALALLLGWVFLALSLTGYHPADAPGVAAEPANATPANPCGPVGATLAFALFQALGWSSYLLLAGLAVVDLLLFRRRRVPELALQALGFALVLTVAAGMIQRFSPGIERSPPVGSGGYLGAIEVTFLEGQFGPAGMFLILSAAGLTGLWLCSEVLLVWPVRELIRWSRAPAGSPWAGGGHPGRRAAGPASGELRAGRSGSRATGAAAGSGRSPVAR